MCASLNLALYFFGHSATTAMEQESRTGLITGLGDYILSHTPQASSMPPATYDDLFGGPWADNRQQEATHRELTKSIGESLRGERVGSTFLIFKIFFRIGFSCLPASLWDNLLLHDRGRHREEEHSRKGQEDNH